VKIPRALMNFAIGWDVLGAGTRTGDRLPKVNVKFKGF
jgi:hypothetical protein